MFELECGTARKTRNEKQRRSGEATGPISEILWLSSGSDVRWVQLGDPDRWLSGFSLFFSFSLPSEKRYD